MYQLVPGQAAGGSFCSLNKESQSKTPFPFPIESLKALVEAIFSFVPEGASSAHLLLGSVPLYAVKPGSLVWTDAQVVRSGQGRSFWIAKGGIAVHKKEPRAARFLVDTGAPHEQRPIPVSKGHVLRLYWHRGFFKSFSAWRRVRVSFA